MARINQAVTHSRSCVLVEVGAGLYRAMVACVSLRYGYQPLEPVTLMK
jgi:hypothetical protein